jgi:hypothetical protein
MMIIYSERKPWPGGYGKCINVNQQNTGMEKAASAAAQFAHA